MSLVALNLDCKHSLIFLSDSGASEIRSARENICKERGKQHTEGREKCTRLFALFRYPRGTLSTIQFLSTLRVTYSKSVFSSTIHIPDGINIKKL